MIKTLKRIGWWLGLGVVSVVLIGLGLWFFGGGVWPLNTNKNILLIKSNIDDNTGEIYLASFLKDRQEIRAVTLDAAAETTVLGGYGQYRLQAIAPLLAIEHKDQAFQQLVWSWSLGLIVDEVVYFDSSPEELRKQDLQYDLRSAVLDAVAQPRRLPSLLQFYFFTRSLSTENFYFESQGMNWSDIESLTPDELTSNCQAAVVNTTAATGLATQLAQLLEKSGVRIVRVADQGSPYQLSTISVASDNLACQSLVERIKVVLPAQTVTIDNQSLRQEQRADLVIMIGEDLAEL